MRISGLATGMDTESIIRDLMKAQRIPLDKITHKKQKLEWQLEDYRSINRNLKTLEYSIRDTVNMEASYIAKTMNNSNPDAVGVKHINSSSNFSGTIEVEKLATNALLQSGANVDMTGKTKLSDMDSLIKDRVSMTINAPGMEKAVTLTFSKDATIDSVIQEINSKTGVSAYLDSNTGKIAMSSKSSGAGEITVIKGEKVDGEDTNDYLNHGNLAELLQLDSTKSTSTLGTNSTITFNGLEMTHLPNKFEINGFQFDLKQVTTSPVTFSSTADVDKVMDTVVKFIDDYNKMLEELNKKIREPVNRSFHPLSAEEKKDMKEKEIELWEEKAKSGALKNDPAIRDMLSNLRNIMNSSVTGSDGKPIRLSDFGITPSKDYLEHGKLVIDENKLREAIAEDPNKLYELIGKANDDPKKAGLSHQFRVVIEDTQKVIAKRAGSVGAVNDTFTLGQSLKDMNSQITKFENRLMMVENRYWKQFNAMESAIQRMNAQSAQLMSQFGG